jgi:hypothetical protein
MKIGSRNVKRIVLIAVAAAGLAGCVAYPAPGYYAADPCCYGPPVSGTVVIGGGGGGGRHWR